MKNVNLSTFFVLDLSFYILRRISLLSWFQNLGSLIQVICVCFSCLLGGGVKTFYHIKMYIMWKIGFVKLLPYGEG